MNTPSTLLPDPISPLTRYQDTSHIRRPACFLPFQRPQAQIGWAECEAEARATACPQRPAETRIQVFPSSVASTPSVPPSPAPGTIPLPKSPRSGLLHLSPSSPAESSPLPNQHRPRISDTSLTSPDSSGSDGNALPSRPGILPSHNHSRSSSSNQSQIQGASFRALRFLRVFF
jgi:hypothetical protein